ncbi:hypothetical protein MRB53_031442 [Persea americana]|uniref:Uncharacterized protein n=1 Tax=Persea americana TaxID=3435 RepID=A0ACC2KP20_PERAE|nr:hypothetical protein MRB53_031442 [Persea americana]
MEDGLLLKERIVVVVEEGERSLRWGAIWEEMKKLGILAGPMVAVGVSQYLLQLISLMMVGHLGEISLSGAALATSLTSVTGFSLLAGMASGLETLCGQAYGAQQYQNLGLHTQRAIFCLLLVSLPISLLWASMGKLLCFMGQDPLISYHAGKYAMWWIPGLFANAIVLPLIKFLQSQSLVLPMVLNSFATLCVHIPLCWVLVFKCGLGNVGAALAISLSTWFGAAILGLYVQYSPSYERTHLRLSKGVFNGLEFLRVAIPSAIMICLEYWSFQLLILLSGLLPNAKLETSVLSICLTTSILLYYIANGFGAAVSTRVSNELGAGNPQVARLATYAAMLISITETVVVSTTLFATRHILGCAYSSEKEVISYVANMVPLLCLSVITDGMQAVVSGNYLSNLYSLP